MNTVTLMIGTSPPVGKAMLNKQFNSIVWASNSLETVSHYWNGCTIELIVALDEKYRGKYITLMSDYSSMNQKQKEVYGWGVTIPNYPKNALWYSFTKEYLIEHILFIREIYPDLSIFNE